MAEREIRLKVKDAQGRRQEVVVRSDTFSIGRGAGNDLILEDEGLSRRHSLIEVSDGRVELSDSGSRNGTFLNDRPVFGIAELKDGDIITIGNACELTVSIGEAGKPERAAQNKRPAKKTMAAAPQEDVQTPVAAQAPWPMTPVLAGLAIIVILVFAALLFVLTKDNGGKVKVRRPVVTDSAVDEADTRGQELPGNSNTSTPAGDDANSATVTDDQIEKEAERLMLRISSDDKPYVFPPNAVEALTEVRRKVEKEMKSPALPDTLRSLQQRSTEVAAMARRESVEPALLIYMALAESDGGQQGDPLAAARRILPDLVSLRITFGTESADKSLIIVAAYKMGSGTKKTHPLLSAMRRLVKNPLTDRNVWFLREHGGLDDSAYHFITSFLAFGVIAQNPRQFGIPAAPLAF